MVIGLLVEQLEQRSHEARAAFAARFAAFDQKAVRSAVHQLHDAPADATGVAVAGPNSPEEPSP
jgi:hypothetical protein